MAYERTVLADVKTVHFIVKYSCGCVQSQCRCPSKEKNITYLDHACPKHSSQEK